MKLVILYGSQTGNSQDVAERIWKQAIQNGHLINDVILSAFDEFGLENFAELRGNNDETRLLFVCSTTGQGDVTYINSNLELDKVSFKFFVIVFFVLRYQITWLISGGF